MSEEVMDDHEFLSALEQLHATEDSDVAELLKMMNENRIISWEEAEQILGDTQTVVKMGDDGIYKSSLPEQTRPSEPDNDTDIERCVQQLNDNDPNLKKINLNNMKRTPIPSIKRLIEAVAYNTVLEELSLANLGLYDTNCEMLPAVLELNTSLKKLNLETNYLSGDFFSKLFKAACVNQTLEEVKAVNQGVSFATTSEKEIIDAIIENRGLTKISLNLRLPEGRHKIENATLRNGEIKRVLRREAAAKAKKEADEAAKKPAPKPEAAPPSKKSSAVAAPVKPAAQAAKPAPKPVAAAKPEPKPEPVTPKAEVIPEPKPEPVKPKPWAPKAAPAKPEPVPEPKPQPVKPRWQPKAAPAKPEPAKPESKPDLKPAPKPFAAKPKAVSPPKEEMKPPTSKPILPKKTSDPVPLPERKTLPVTARSTSSRTSFLKETLEAKAKEGDKKKTVRKVIRKMKKPVEETDAAEIKTARNGDVNGVNGEDKEEKVKKESDTNGNEKEEEKSNESVKAVEEEKKMDEKTEETKPKRTVVRKVLRKKKKEEDEEKEKTDEEARTALGDDYLTTRPRRRSSAVKAL